MAIPQTPRTVAGARAAVLVPTFDQRRAYSAMRCQKAISVSHMSRPDVSGIHLSSIAAVES
jgi:hypothetical protein